MLRPEDHDRFLKDGFLHLPGLLSPDLVESLLSSLTDASSVDCPSRSSTKEALEASVTPELLEAVGDLFAPMKFKVGWGPVHKPRVFEPGVLWGMPGHIDNHYPTIMPVRTIVSAIIFLTAVRSRGGAFCVYPGSHRTNRELMIQGYGEFLAERWDKPTGMVELPAAPGDVVLFHYLLGHSASRNVADPVTRQALVVRFHQEPTGTPTLPISDVESTLGKASSTKAMLPSGAARPVATPEPPTDSDVVTHVVLRLGGSVHYLWVDASDTTVVRHHRSEDLREWCEEMPLLVPGKGGINALSLSTSPTGRLLAVSRADGTYLMKSGRELQWDYMISLPLEARPVALFWASRFATRRLAETILYWADNRPSPGGPALVHAVSAPRWEELELDKRKMTSVAQRHDLAIIREIIIEPTISNVHYALVLEGSLAGGERAILASQSSEVSNFNDFHPLQYDGTTVPTSLRVYDRAADYWLVSYLRVVAGSRLPRWGAIDWTDQGPVLREITSVTDLSSAYRRIGLR